MAIKIGKPKGLTAQILVAMTLGLILGVLINLFFLDVKWVDEYLLKGVLHFGGTIFIASLKLLVVPLVFISIICGVASLEDISKLGRVGGKTILLYMSTTAIAIALALLVASLIGPGEGFNLTTSATFLSKESPPLVETLINIFPTNPIKSMAEGKMLQIIVFSTLVGIALTTSGEPGKRLLPMVEDINEVIMKMVMMVMLIAPYGVFCLIAKVFANQGFEAIMPLLKYFIVVLGVLILHVALTYFSLLKFLARVSIRKFWQNFKNVPIFAFSTASSGATIPLTLEAAEKRLGVHNSVASFVIPLGATINMDGTAIMQGVATIFIAQAYGIDIGLSGMLSVVLTATLASVGTAGVPGVGLITLAMVLRQVNLPVEGIGLIIGVDRLLDMARTAVNVTGDAMVSLVVAKSEGNFSQEIFDEDQSE